MTTSTFCNLVTLQSADPWVYRHSDGHYYFMHTFYSRRICALKIESSNLMDGDWV